MEEKIYIVIIILNNQKHDLIGKGIPNDSLEMIVRFFNPDIADEYVILTKTKRYQWNLIDSRFHDLHQYLKV